jgi:putative heme-binding domain-containing protein
VSVRSQLACTARRLPPKDGLPIVERIMLRDLDGRDPHVPLLLWWAVEHHAMDAMETVLAAFTTPAAWKTALGREVILPRLMRRYAAEGTEAAYTACARLLASAPSAADRSRMVAALDQGLRERPTGQPDDNSGTLFKDLGVVRRPTAKSSARTETIPPALETQLAGLWREDTTDATFIRVMARLSRPAAHARALTLAVDTRVPSAQRVSMLGVLAEVGRPACVVPVLKLLESGESEAVQLAALGVLQRFEDAKITDALLQRYPRLSPRLRSRACDVLLSRWHSARVLLRAVDQGRLAAKDIAVDQVRPVALYHDKDLDALVRKHWGNVTSGTPEEKLAEMRRLSNDLRAGTGDPVRGRAFFQRTCASCHRLFGEGNLIGPDLTHANRKDRDYLLANIVDPSAVIRREYLSYVVHLRDGRVLTGLIGEQTAGSITLVSAKNERTTVARDQIEGLDESPVSLMPENLLKDLKPQELRDLFRYLQK